MKYLRNRNQENWNLYTTERNRINARIREIKEDYWERFTKEMERYVRKPETDMGNAKKDQIRNQGYYADQ